MTRDTRSRLTEAAFFLFETNGFDATTVDDIASQAGVSKTTFFRIFRSKEEVIFPDHDVTMREISTRFEMSDDTDRLLNVCAAARHVLTKYIKEGEIARSRFRLTTSVEALRDRELASVHRYQRIFRRYLSEGAPDGRAGGLNAEIQAATVVTANNYVIRRWLRGVATEPLAEFDEVCARILAADWSTWGTNPVSKSARRTSIAVIETCETPARVLELLRRALEGASLKDSIGNVSPDG